MPCFDYLILVFVEAHKLLKNTKEVQNKLEEYNSQLKGRKLDLKQLGATLIQTSNPIYLREKLDQYEISNLKKKVEVVSSKKDQIKERLIDVHVSYTMSD